MTSDLSNRVLEAVRAHQGGRLDEAEALYRAVLDEDPASPDALHFLGVLSFQRGRAEEAEKLIRAALDHAPRYADAHNNLGNVLKHRRRFGEARQAYEAALAIRPDDANALNNLGAALHAEERIEEAWETYGRAIECDPRHADAFVNRGNLLKRTGRIHEAIDHYLHALTLRRFHTDAYRNLGYSLYAVGRISDALSVFRQWLEIDPDSSLARHMVAACSGENAPPRASDEYIREYFARFADSFDSVLGELEYRAPELVAASVAATAEKPAACLDVLDAGCGTGLCGPLLRPYARRLVGVDLSEKMADKARGRAVYDAIEVAELTGFLAANARAFDLVVSADTLVYFGDLAPVCGVASTALRPDGRFIFTVERAADDAEEFRIQPHGRFHHGEQYVRRVLADSGFAVEEVGHATLRQEHRQPVPGLVVRARRIA